MSNIHEIFKDQRRKFEDVKRTAFDGGGGGGYDDHMEERVKKLEEKVDKVVERIVNIERDVAVVRSNYATGKDVSDAKNSIVMWVVGAIFVAQLLPMLKDFVKPSVQPTIAAPAGSSTPK